MAAFDPRDPFPLVQIPYEEEKAHSALVDEWLGLKVGETEASLAKVKDDQERWVKQGPAVFLTPYTEIRCIFEELAPPKGSLVVDLGAGYGRIGFVLARHFPDCNFLGLELVAERVAAGNAALKAFGAKNAELRCADLARDVPPLADIYFLYDFGARAAIAACLDRLREVARQRPIALVARGGAVRSQIGRSHPWLCAEVKHHPHYSIHRSG